MSQTRDDHVCEDAERAGSQGMNELGIALDYAERGMWSSAESAARQAAARFCEANILQAYRLHKRKEALQEAGA